MKYCYFYSYFYIFVSVGRSYCNSANFPEWLWRYCRNSRHPGGLLTAVSQDSYSQMYTHEHKTWTNVLLPAVLNSGNFLELRHMRIAHGGGDRGMRVNTSVHGSLGSTVAATGCKTTSEP